MKSSGIGLIVHLDKEKSVNTATVTKEKGCLDTLSGVVTELQSLGYHARLTDDGILTGASIAEDDGSSREFAMIIKEEDNKLEFMCQLATIGELDVSENSEVLASLGWVLLAINAEIQPWAVALLNPDGVLDETDIVILTHSVPLGDFSPEELESAMSDFGKALTAVVPTYIAK